MYACVYSDNEEGVDHIDIVSLSTSEGRGRRSVAASFDCMILAVGGIFFVCCFSQLSSSGPTFSNHPFWASRRNISLNRLRFMICSAPCGLLLVSAVEPRQLQFVVSFRYQPARTSRCALVPASLYQSLCFSTSQLAQVAVLHVLQMQASLCEVLSMLS